MISVCDSTCALSDSNRWTLATALSLSMLRKRPALPSNPANAAVVTILGTAGKIYRQSLMYHQDAFVMGTGRLPDTTDAGAPAKFVTEGGFEMRMNRQALIRDDSQDTRFDTLYGMTGNVREWSVKLWTPVN